MNSTPFSAGFCTPAWFHHSSGAHEHRPSNADVAQGIAAPALHLRYMPHPAAIAGDTYQ